MVNSNFRYDAFISYSRKRDAKIASNIQGFLEKFPDSKSGGGSEKERLHICRDGNDFNLLDERGDVSEMLEGHLENSKRLIVLCSIETPKSEWIRQEIRWFLDNRGPEAIVICTTDNPGDKPERFFPTEIVEAGLHVRPYFNLSGLRTWALWPSKRRDDSEDQLAQLASNMLGLSRGEVVPSWVREANRRRNRLRRVWQFSVLTAVVVISTFVWQLLLAWKNTEETQQAEALSKAAKQFLDVREDSLGLVIDSGKDRGHILNNKY